MKYAVPAFALLMSCAFAATAGDWTLQPEGSSLRFSGVAQGEAFQGKFTEFTPKIHFDPAALDTARFDVTIKLASADTRNQERDEALGSSDFFDVQNYPEARFVATEFAAVEGGFEARGALELRGTRQPVTLSFTWTPGADGAKLEGKARLDRTAFGVGSGDWADPESIAHEVDVATTLVLVPAG
jgi:polyisoprenoid-binding protein YceI